MTVSSILSALPTAAKDQRRIALFLVACQVKAIEIAATDPQLLVSFASDAARLVQEWVPNWQKVSISWLWSDPYKQARENVRRFAVKWRLDPVFIAEMG